MTDWHHFNWAEAEIPGPNQSWARPGEARLGGASGCRGCEVRSFVKSPETDDTMRGFNRACVTLMRAITQTGRLIWALGIVTWATLRGIKLFLVWPGSRAEFFLSIPESWAGTRVCCSYPRRAAGWRTGTRGRPGWSRGRARGQERDLSRGVRMSMRVMTGYDITEVVSGGART